ncbi:hypothetical protein Mgra_00003692 [Meloidogyne graminicola]|uniref:Uncharacterized protein n=1 Tax=Meloidogyne graminicola TaxID=189291 RepID=A0A8S9ZTC9_9BILA|nr:hypothetical protein Mgra_00003692 [Meloidogyne graminicola]
MKKQQSPNNRIKINRKSVESKIEGKSTKTEEKNKKLIKDERDGKKLELPVSLKNKSKEKKEEQKIKKQEKEKKVNKEKIKTTLNSREKSKSKEELFNKKGEESIYEDDFEDYESDFEEDLDENEESKDIRLDEIKEEESILRKKLTGINGTKIIENEKSEWNKEAFELQQKVLDVPQEDKKYIQEDIEPEKTKEKNGGEWFADYFKEVTGQNKYRKQAFAQTEGSELNAYCQTDSVEKVEIGTQTKRYSSNTLEAKQNNGLDLFIETAGQLIIGLLQRSSFSNFEKISSIFSAQRLTLSLNSLFTEKSTENRISTIAYKAFYYICTLFICNCFFQESTYDLYLHFCGRIE